MICCKRLKIEGDTLKLDRLTDLPINVKHKIQEHLSIEEAAKMSVLSTPWRHVWATIPKLVFSAQFCNNKPSGKLIDIINTVLSQHVGAMKTFLVNISSIPKPQHSVIDEWILLLSKNGIKDLTLENLDNAHYKLPSYMYGVELERLDLSTCIFRPPSSFRGFHKLRRLSLRRVILLLDTHTSVLWMPNLRRLHAMACRPFHHFKIYAPKLLILDFSVTGPVTINLDHFMDCRKPKRVALQSQRNRDKVMNLTNLLSCCPEVRHLFLDGYYLKSFASDVEVERLPTCLDRLRLLCSYSFDFDDEDQIFSLLRMLRSTPKLKDPLFKSGSKMKSGVEDDVNQFGERAYSSQGLNKLQKLKIEAFHGLRAKLLFLRFILASAPLLLKIILLVHESVHDREYLKISEELMGFPRASPKLEIICELPKQARRVLH